jgi:hypothetical protein
MKPDWVFRIVPGSDGLLTVLDDSNHPVVRNLRNEREALSALQDYAGVQGILLNVIRTSDGRIDRIEGRRPVILNVSITPDLDHLIGELAADIGTNKAETIVRGLALLKAAVDAKKKGKVVGTAESSESLETEFVGF